VKAIEQNKMTKTFISNSLDQYQNAVDYIIDLMEDYTVFTLEGNLGAGKTTFVQQICKKLGTKDIVTSPTFSLINPYITDKGQIFHMDMYRLEHMEEAIDFGIEEYLWDGHICFIEWPELIEPILPDLFVRIKIELQEDQSREIAIETIITNPNE